MRKAKQNLEFLKLCTEQDRDAAKAKMDSLSMDDKAREYWVGRNFQARLVIRMLDTMGVTTEVKD